MLRKKHIRGIAISFFVIAISFFNFNNLKDSGCIRAIHVVTLLVCGMGIALLLSNAIALISNRNR
jgi:hypothetical protein